MAQKIQTLDVWGELACFSRPELKVERFSYPIITPSASRGIFDAIYCKPKEFRWQITKVEVLSKPSYIALRRNEVKEKVSVNAVTDYRLGKKEPVPIWADGDKSHTGSDEKGRTQRQTMALKNVHYRLHGEILPWPGFEDRQQGLEMQFRRRASKGKCIYQPYFGCREFAAYFELVDNKLTSLRPVPINMDNLGWMLFDVFDLSRPGSDMDDPAISLFQPQVKQGIMIVPDYESDQVYRASGGEG